MADKKISALTGASTPLAGTEVLPIVQSGNTVKVSVANLTAGRSVAASDISTTGNILAGATSNVANCRVLAENATGQQLGARYTGVATHYLSVESNGDAVFNRDGTVWARLVNSSLDYQFTAGNLIQGTAAKGINFTANTPAAGMTSQLLNWYEEGTWTPVFNPGSGTITTQTCSGRYTRIGRLVTVQFSIVIDNVGTGAGVASVSGLPFTSANTADVGSGAVREYNSTGYEWNFTVNPNATTMYPARYDNTNTIGTGYAWRGSVTYMV